MFGLSFCCPLIILFMLTFAYLAVCSVNTIGSAKGKNSLAALTGTNIGGTAAPHDYLDTVCLFVPLPLIHPSISAAVFHFRKGYGVIFPLISLLFKVFPTHCSTYRLMSPPWVYGIIQLIDYFPLFLISLTESGCRFYVTACPEC